MPDPDDVTATDNCDEEVVVNHEDVVEVVEPSSCIPDNFEGGTVVDCGSDGSAEFGFPQGYSIEFTGFVAYEEDCQTCYYYCINNNGVSPSISHSAFGEENCAETCLDELDFANDMGTWIFDGNGQVVHNAGDGLPGQSGGGNNPNNDLCGAKFDQGLENDETLRAYICVTGFHNPGTIDFNIKAGQVTETIQIPGPADCSDNCDCDEEGCIYTITRTWTATDNCGNSTARTRK